MRSFIFNFSAKKVEELGIKGNPVIILNYLDQFFKSGNAKVKEQNNKNYFWITYNKIVNDNLFLDIKHQRVKQIIDELCDKGVLEKYDNGGSHYTTLYLYINYSKLQDQDDEDMINIVGVDNTLKQYMLDSRNYYSAIKYNAFNYCYETPAVNTALISKNHTRFKNILLTHLKLLLSDSVYTSISKKINISTFKNGIKLEFELTAAIIESIALKLECALAGAYITLLTAENHVKTNHKNVTQLLPNQSKNTANLSHIIDEIVL